MKIIDFHTHLDSHWFDQPLISETEFLQGLDRLKVEQACVFTLMGFYGNCREHNDKLLAAAQRHPERLFPFVTVDPKLGREAVIELERCLGNPIFKGIKFHPWLQAFAPSMVRATMEKILELAATQKVPIIFHDGTPPYSTTLQIAEVARWRPDTNIVLGHAGLSDYLPLAGQLLRDIPNLYGCFCGPKAGELRYLVETAGAEKILFGSDFGIADWKLLAERLDAVLESGVGEAELRLILSGNAARLLNDQI